MEQPTLQRFSPHLDETFSAVLDDAELPLVLVEATSLGAPPIAGMSHEPFSLVFRSHTLNLLPQGFYRLRHALLGELEIFLVPVARHPQGFEYQAIFN